MKAVLAIAIGLVGLFMTTCGLFFMSFVNAQNLSLLSITVPSVGGGLLLLWGAQVLWKKHKAGKAAGSNPR